MEIFKMKKAFLFIILLFSYYAIFANITPSDVGDNGALAKCINTQGDYNASDLKYIPDLDCSCAGVYPVNNQQVAVGQTCTYVYVGFFRRKVCTPVFDTRDINQDDREACQKAIKYGNKQFVVTSFKGLNQLKRLETLNLSDNDFSGLDKNETTLINQESDQNGVDYRDLLKKVVITNSNLRYAPSIPRNVRFLDISGNNIGAGSRNYEYSDNKALSNLITYRKAENLKSLRYLNIKNNPIESCDGHLDTSIGFIIAQELKKSDETNPREPVKGAIKDSLNLYGKRPPKLGPGQYDDYLDTALYDGQNLRTVDFDKTYNSKLKNNKLSRKDREALAAIDYMTENDWGNLEEMGEEATVSSMLSLASTAGHDWMIDVVLEHFPDYFDYPEKQEPVHYNYWRILFEYEILSISNPLYLTIDQKVPYYFQYIFGESDPVEIDENYSHNGMNREELLKRFLDKMDFNYKYFYLYFVKYPTIIK